MMMVLMGVCHSPKPLAVQNGYEHHTLPEEKWDFGDPGRIAASPMAKGT